MAFGTNTHHDNPFAPPAWMKGRAVDEKDANARSFHCADCSSYVTVETWAESLRCSTCNGTMILIPKAQRRAMRLAKMLEDL